MVSVRERCNSLLAGLLLLFAIESFDKALANDGRWVKAEEEEEGFQGKKEKDFTNFACGRGMSRVA